MKNCFKLRLIVATGVIMLGIVPTRHASALERVNDQELSSLTSVAGLS